MARPRIYAEERVSTQVRLPAELHRELHREAGDRDVSVNLLVTRAVEHYLTRLPAVADVTSPGESE